MLGRLGLWRHVVVAVSILGCAALALLGFIGGRGESFDAKQITVSPAGNGGVRIREVVDEDFGNSSRHGYERIIPNDAGAPEDIEASSPDANADVQVDTLFENDGTKTRIRLGDPGTTYTGQHRYILEYTLPQAIVSDALDVDIIDSGEEFSTKRFEVIVTGFGLDNPQCNVGEQAAEGGCTLQQVGNDYRVLFTPLAKGDGVNVGGTITSIGQGTEPPLPDLPARAADYRVQLALGMIPLGLAGALGVFIWARRSGRNEVFSGGAAEAAYGTLPAPGAGGLRPAVSTRLVPDTKMEELTTIEFVPPKGIDPWQGAVLLTEKINDETIAAWFSGLAAKEAITLDKQNGDLVVGSGPRREQLDPANAAIVNQFLNGRSEMTLGSYDSHFASAWRAVRNQQVETIRQSGWWKRRPPGASGASSGATVVRAIVIIAFLVLFIGGSALGAVLGFARSIPAALAFGLVVPTVVALIVYAVMLPARSATGSALALLTESFRRFLAASEGRHVEWAWKQGLLREYSAWAVALGAADAWGRALANSNVPEPEYAHTNPLLVYSMASAFSHSHTAPSSSGGGGGGFSGGGVGGGAGGGSSGSW